MSLSLTGRTALSFGAVLRFDRGFNGFAPRVKTALMPAGAKRSKPRLGVDQAAHSLLADAQGVWAWSPRDPHAAATRHAGLRDWMTLHPGSDAQIWMAADLLRDRESGGEPMVLGKAASVGESARSGQAVATSGFDSLRSLAAFHGIRMQSVSPWWHHAFVAARRCVNAVDRLGEAHVWVVEGKQVTWIVIRTGVLSEVRQITLDTASLGGLRATMARSGAAHADRPDLTVALGQGLVGGHRTGQVNALVLGRLDGEQPPQWLRPGAAVAPA